MTRMLLISLTLLGIVQPQGSPPHPAVYPTAEQLAAAFDRGSRQPRSVKNGDRVRRPFTKSLGKYSELRFDHPLLQAYEAGLKARQSPLTVTASSREAEIERLTSDRSMLRFHGNIVIRSRTTLFRGPNSKDLKGFQVWLVVGPSTVEPIRQPGDLAAKRETVWVNTTVSQSNGDGTYTVDTIQTPEIAYTGQFDVTFALLGPDGKPHIAADADRFTVIVSGGFGTYRAEYKLSELPQTFK